MSQHHTNQEGEAQESLVEEDPVLSLLGLSLIGGHGVTLYGAGGMVGSRVVRVRPRSMGRPGMR